MKSTVFWDVTPHGRVKFTDVSERYAVSIFKVEE
jgi:hypothetical protein